MQKLRALDTLLFVLGCCLTCCSKDKALTSADALPPEECVAGAAPLEAICQALAGSVCVRSCNHSHSYLRSCSSAVVLDLQHRLCSVQADVKDFQAGMFQFSHPTIVHKPVAHAALCPKASAWLARRILCLPCAKRVWAVRAVEFTQEERNQYLRMHREADVQFQRYRSVGPARIGRYLLQIMALLGPLRLICSGGLLRPQVSSSVMPRPGFAQTRLVGSFPSPAPSSASTASRPSLTLVLCSSTPTC